MSTPPTFHELTGTTAGGPALATSRGINVCYNTHSSR